jgi:hypothetical protein
VQNDVEQVIENEKLFSFYLSIKSPWFLKLIRNFAFCIY